MTEETGSTNLNRNTRIWPVAVFGIGLGIIIPLAGAEHSGNPDDDVPASRAFADTLTKNMADAFNGHPFSAMDYSITGEKASDTFTFDSAEVLTLDAMDVDHDDPRNKAIAGCAVAAFVDMHNHIPADAGAGFNAGQFDTAEAACQAAVHTALEAHVIDHLYGLTGLVTR